jgi:AcrR family transcriptional regulator
LREIARRAGVSVAAPSRHFRGKEDLLAAIASDGFAELIKARKKIAMAELEPLAKTRAMMLSYVNFALAHEGLFSLMVGPRVLEEYRGDEFLATSSESFDYFATSVQELATANGWPKDRLHDVTYAAWSMEHGVAALILAKMIPREGIKLRLRRIIDFAIDMLLSAVVAGPDSLEGVKSQISGFDRAATPPRAIGSGPVHKDSHRSHPA